MAAVAIPASIPRGGQTDPTQFFRREVSMIVTVRIESLNRLKTLPLERFPFENQPDQALNHLAELATHP